MGYASHGCPRQTCRIGEGEGSAIGCKTFGSDTRQRYGFAIGRSIIFLDNTFKDSPRADKEFGIGDLRVGIAVMIDSVRISYMHVLRTPFLETQDGPDSFGPVSVSIRLAGALPSTSAASAGRGCVHRSGNRQ